jgi:3-oxoacyl-(acyl-carrier-protein) synthase
LAEARCALDRAGEELPQIAGFVESAFSPLVAALADMCLSGFYETPPAPPAEGERTAIVLTSATGDLATAAAVAAAVEAGRRVAPLLFYQSTPTAVAGYVAARWGLSGPVVCTMPGRFEPGTAMDASSRTLAEAREAGEILIGDGDADAALVIAANAYLDGAACGAAELIGPPSWSPRSTAAGAVKVAESLRARLAARTKGATR